MRDINRIDPIIEELKKYWKANQDLRFGQLYYLISKRFDEYSIKNNENLFYAEDDKWLSFFKEINKSDT